MVRYLKRSEEGKSEGFFLIAGDRYLFSLMKNLTFPRSLASVPLQELTALLLIRVVPVNSQATGYAKFHSSVRGQNVRFHEFILTLQSQLSKCNFGDQLEIHLGN